MGGKARHLVQSLRHEFRRWLATKRNVESNNRVRRCTPG
jgi:hypothetical protein